MYIRLICAALTGILVCAGCRGERSPNHYVMSKGYTGKVEIRFGIPGSNPLRIVDGATRYDVPPSGILSTSTRLPVGYGEDKYYDGDVSEGTRLYQGSEATGPGKPPLLRSIWRCRVEVVPGRSTSYNFFVGTADQLREFERKHGEIQQ